MATLREFILSQSTLPTGNTVRDHIQNPGSGGDPYPVYYQEINVEAVDPAITASVPSGVVIEVIQGNIEVVAESENIEIKVE